MSKILIVDDETDLSEILAMDFEIEGFDAFRAESVDEALELFQSHKPDLVLSDMRMPQKSGFDLLTSVRQQLASQVGFILMSGYSDLGIDDVFEAGADAFVPKPYDRDQLLILAKRFLLPLGKARFEKGLFSLPHKNLIRGSDGVLQDVSLGLQGFFAPLDAAAKSRLAPNVSLEFEITAQGQVLKGNGVIRWRRNQDSGALPAGIGVEIWDLEEKSLQVFDSLVQGLGSARIPKAPKLSKA